jgi:hypothetical protein
MDFAFRLLRAEWKGKKRGIAAFVKRKVVNLPFESDVQ